MMPEPGTQAYENMIDFMRKDLASGMGYSNIEMIARNICKKNGEDFDEKFKKWKEKNNAERL